jgi:hypothetical protein
MPPPDEAGAPLLKSSSNGACSSSGGVGGVTAAACAGAPASPPTPAQRRAAVRIQRRVRAYLDGKKTQRRACVSRAWPACCARAATLFVACATLVSAVGCGGK